MTEPQPFSWEVYGVNPAEGRGRMLEGMDLILKP